MKILSLIEQWCDGNISCGFSQPSTHYLACFNCRDVRFVHWDCLDPSKLSDSLDQSLKEDPDLCLYCDMPHPNRPLDSTLSRIASRIPLVALWHDVAKGGFRNIPGASLNVGMDGAPCPLPNYVPMWTPVDASLFGGSPLQLRPIPVCHPGSRSHKSMGREIEKVLREKGVDMQWFGGQREDRLTWGEYAKVMRSSKIVVDFPRDNGSMGHQLKGRVFESVACGAALITEDHEGIKRHFNSGEVLLYHSAEECADLCLSLLKDDQNRINLATRGQNKFLSRWRLEMWWEKIFDSLGI